MKFNKKVELFCSAFVLQGSFLMALMLDRSLSSDKQILITSAVSLLVTQLIGIRFQSYICVCYLKSQFNKKKWLFALFYNADIESKEYDTLDSQDLFEQLLSFLKLFNYFSLSIQFITQLVWIQINMGRYNYFLYFLPQIVCFLILTKQIFFESMKNNIRKFYSAILLIGDIIAWGAFIYGMVSCQNVQRIYLYLIPLLIPYFISQLQDSWKGNLITFVLIQSLFSIYPTQILMKKKTEQRQSEKQFNKITYYFKLYQKFLQVIYFFSCSQQIIALSLLILAFIEPILIQLKQLMFKFRKLEVKDIQNLKKINNDVFFQQVQIKKYSKVNLKIPFTTENQYETVISLLFSFGKSEIRDSHGNSRVSQGSFLTSEKTSQTVTIKCLCNKNFIKYFYQKLISMQSIYIQRNYQNWMETMKKLIDQLNLNLSHQIQSIYVSSLADTKSYIDHCKFFQLFTFQVQLLNLPEQIQNIHDSYILKTKQVTLLSVAFNKLIAEFQITNPQLIFYSLFE
ncbi:hypothetical protein ABPG74_020186 [Tetrahymena malaccensis]